jgi:hypothetical protein
MKKSSILILIILSIGCIKCAEKDTTVKLNENLIHFEEIRPSGHLSYLEFKSKLENQDTLDVSYVEEFIIITKFIEGNECLPMTGDIQIKNDSILLLSFEISNEKFIPCDGLEIKKLNYIVKNEKNKHYKFGYKGVNLYTPQKNLKK